MESALKQLKSNRYSRIHSGDYYLDPDSKSKKPIELPYKVEKHTLLTLSRSLTPRSKQLKLDEEYADSVKKDPSGRILSSKGFQAETVSNRLRNSSKDSKTALNKVISSQTSLQPQLSNYRLSIHTNKKDGVPNELQKSLTTKLHTNESHSRSRKEQNEEKNSKLLLQFGSPMLKTADKAGKLTEPYQCQNQFKNTWSDFVKMTRGESPSGSSRNKLKSSLLSPSAAAVTPFNFKADDNLLKKNMKGFSQTLVPKTTVGVTAVAKKHKKRPESKKDGSAKGKASRDPTPPSVYSVKDSNRFLTYNFTPGLVAKSRLPTEPRPQGAQLEFGSQVKSSASRDSSWHHKPAVPRCTKQKTAVQQPRKRSIRPVDSAKGLNVQRDTTESRRSESGSVGIIRKVEPKRLTAQMEKKEEEQQPKYRVTLKPSTLEPMPAQASASDIQLSKLAQEYARAAVQNQPPVVAMRQHSQISAYAVQTFRLDIEQLLQRTETSMGRNLASGTSGSTTANASVVNKKHDRITVFFTQLTRKDMPTLSAEDELAQFSLVGLYTSPSALVASLLKKSLHHSMKTSENFPYDMAAAFVEALQCLAEQCHNLLESTEGTDLQVLVADGSETLYYFSNHSRDGSASHQNTCWIDNVSASVHPSLGSRDLKFIFGGRPIHLRMLRLTANSPAYHTVVLCNQPLTMPGKITSEDKDLPKTMSNVLEKFTLSKLCEQNKSRAGSSVHSTTGSVPATLSLAVFMASGPGTGHPAKQVQGSSKDQFSAHYQITGRTDLLWSAEIKTQGRGPEETVT